MTQRRPLRALIVEDSPDDADLLLLELRREGWDVRARRVEDAAGLAAALEEGPWDVVISDYSLPSFDARAALAMVQARGLDLPFIIVSGTVGEDIAVAAMKAGAHDYLVKGKLKRLAATIERELREAANRAERRRAEAQVRQSEARYRALVEELPDLVLALSGDHLSYANPAAARALGVPSAELVGRPLEALLDPRDREAGQTMLEGVLAGRSGATELRFRRSDGESRVVEVRGQLLPADGGERSIVLVAQDVTEHRRAQEQLMIADRMASVGLLAAGIAHEINNPLAAVLGNLEFAVDAVRPAGVPEVEAALRDAREATETAMRIVRDVRVFSRGEDHQHLGPVDVRAVLDSSLRMAWNEVRHRARVRRDYGEVPPVLANDGRLGQVFLNLIVNAAQAIPDGRLDRNEIRLTVRADGPRVRVEIADTGAGTPPEVLRQLFTPFVTTKPRGVGTGLGLSICRRIVTDLGGTIEIDSAVGGGTTVRIGLPVAAGVAPTPPREAERAQPAHATVLVLDDQELVGRALQRWLAQVHDVEVAVEARAALERIRAGRRYDVILCDVMMPNMSGIEFYGELRQFAPDQADAIVFMTGGAFSPAARAFLEQVPNPRLEKPFDRQKLAAALGRRLRR